MIEILWRIGNKMSLLNRRIFVECMKLFFTTLLVLMLFVLMGRALQLKDMLFGLELEMMDTFLLFIFLTPSFLLIIAPISAMIAVFLTFLRMGSERELVAIKAGGVSLYQLLVAPILFALFCTFVTFLISYTSISWGAESFRTLLLDVAQNRVSIALQAGTFNRDIPNIVFFARQVDTQSGALAQVMIEDKSNADGAVTILAPQGNLDVNYELGDIFLLLQDGIMYSENEQKMTQLTFDEYVVRFPLNSLIKGLDLGAVKPKEMHWEELAAFDLEAIAEKEPLVSQALLSELHKRVLFPLSCFVLVVFVIPIATSFQGLQKQVGLLVALAFFFVYYTIISVGMNFVEYNFANPYLVIWLPVAIFFLLGLYGIHLSAIERMPSLRNGLYNLRQKMGIKIKQA